MKVTLKLLTQQQLDAAFALKADKEHASSRIVVLTKENPRLIIEKTNRQLLSRIANAYTTLRGCKVEHFVREDVTPVPPSLLPWWKGIDRAISEIDQDNEISFNRAVRWLEFFKGTHNPSRYPEVMAAARARFGKFLGMNERMRHASLDSVDLRALMKLEKALS